MFDRCRIPSSSGGERAAQGLRLLGDWDQKLATLSQIILAPDAHPLTVACIGLQCSGVWVGGVANRTALLRRSNLFFKWDIFFYSLLFDWDIRLNLILERGVLWRRRS
jgi:hypothetical protein